MMPATSVAPEAGVLAVLPLADVFALAAGFAEAGVWVAEFACVPLSVAAARSLFSLSEIDAALVLPLPPDDETTLLFWLSADAFTIWVRFPSAVVPMPASSVFAVVSAVAEPLLDCAAPDFPEVAEVSVEFVLAVLLAAVALPAADPSDVLDVCFVPGWDVSGVAA
jgi:hypothetical protein